MWGEPGKSRRITAGPDPRGAEETASPSPGNAGALAQRPRFRGRASQSLLCRAHYHHAGEPPPAPGQRGPPELRSKAQPPSATSASAAMNRATRRLHSTTADKAKLRSSQIRSPKAERRPRPRPAPGRGARRHHGAAAVRSTIQSRAAFAQIPPPGPRRSRRWPASASTPSAAGRDPAVLPVMPCG